MGLEGMIYESMMGNLVKPIRGIENAFASGTHCEQLYDEIYMANRRICERLGVEEDTDVELIVSNFLELNRELCIRMFGYGTRFG